MRIVLIWSVYVLMTVMTDLQRTVKRVFEKNLPFVIVHLSFWSLHLQNSKIAKNNICTRVLTPYWLLAHPRLIPLLFISFRGEQDIF